MTSSRGASAGTLLLAAIILCGLIGFGLGYLLGIAVPLGVIGVCLGVPVGTVAVYKRFKDL